MATKKTTEPARVLLVKTVDGELKVTLPDDAKVTFGPAIPGPRSNHDYENKREYALRIYRGSKENLLAVFTGVREFREITMPVAKLVVREAGKSVWKSDETGYSVEASVKKDHEFVSELNLLESGNER